MVEKIKNANWNRIIIQHFLHILFIYLQIQDTTSAVILNKTQVRETLKLQYRLWHNPG